MAPKFNPKYVEVDLGYDPNINDIEDVIRRFRGEEKTMNARDFSLCSDEHHSHILAQWKRDETEEEEKSRLENLSKLEKRQLEYERQKYEELRKKFESESK